VLALPELRKEATQRAENVDMVRLKGVKRNKVSEGWFEAKNVAGVVEVKMRINL